MYYKMKEIPIEERPRERLKEIGIRNLSDKEIIAILLKNGTKNQNVNDLSLEILKRYNLLDLRNISMKELTNIKGIGEVKAMQLLAGIELGKRVYLRETKKLKKLNNAKAIWESSKYLFQGEKQEKFYCYYFNNKQELLKQKLIFMGTINSATTHTREVFKEAYRLSATSIVCLHNHPSNDVMPSKADIIFTEKLMKTGEFQGIPVVDHIIVGESQYFSFYEHQNTTNLEM